MRNKKKKRIITLIVFVMIIIIEIIAFRLSTANKVVSLKFSFQDKDSKIENNQLEISAIDKGKNGYLLTLPERLKGLKVSSYYLKQDIINLNTQEVVEPENKQTQENTTDTSQNVEASENHKSENSTQESSQTTNGQTNSETQEKTTIQNQSNTTDSNNTNSTLNNIDNANNTLNEKNSNETTSNKTTSNNTTTNTNQTEKEPETIPVELDNQYIKIEPTKEIYIPKEAIDNLIIQVKYDTIEKNSQIFYQQEISQTINNTKITATGYLPAGATIQAEEVDTADVTDTILESQKEKVNIHFVYDIKIKVGEKEYQPEEFGNQVQIQISGINVNQEKQNKILHIDDKKAVDEIKIIEKKKDEITFQTTSFSLYALVTDATADDALTVTGIPWDGSIAQSFQYGEGTQNFPYLITSGEELAYLASRVNNGETFEGIHFQLTEDLNLNQISWTPIGTITNSFRGIFNGAGHCISNVSIVINSNVNDVVSYGIFGSIGGGSSYSEIKNLELNGVTIDLAVTRTIASNSYGYKIGTVTGTMYHHSKIANVIVKNSKVIDSGTISFEYTSSFWGNSTYYQPILFVGGIVGDSVNSVSSEQDPGTDARYILENCYSDVDFTLDVISENSSAWGSSSSSNMSSFGQYHVGGIIGRIKSQPKWPSNCLHTGSIDATNAFTGPIFGAAVGNTSYTSTGNFNTLWEGNDVGSGLSLNSYYSNYSTNSTAFTPSVISGTTPTNATYRRSTNTSNIGYVQGVNKGSYLSSISQMQTNFNQYANNNQYLTWNYSGGTYSLNKPLSATVTEDPISTFTAEATSQKTNPTFTYEWHIDGSPEVASTQNTIQIEHDVNIDHTAVVLISDGEYYTTVSILIKPYTLYFEITYNETNNSLVAEYRGTYASSPFFNQNDYTLQWYNIDLTDETPNKEKIEGKTALTLTNVDKRLDYMIEGTNPKNPKFSATGSYSDKTVIYVDYEQTKGGNDSNDGLTPETPVRSMQTAYSKLDRTKEKEENIIVIMGNYLDGNYLNSENSTTYNIPATIVGTYNYINYNANLYFEGENNYKYLAEDTKFKNMTFDANYGQTYLYVQGFDLTMDEGIRLKDYNRSNTNQGLISDNAPAFHIFGGWYRYNDSKLPRNNNTIEIKSGTYARIIAGGSPGAIGSSSTIAQATTSRNFTGSSLDDIFTSTINIDIKNSTTDFTAYDYDVNLVVGGSAWGNTYANVTENIYNGKVGRILGASIGDASTKPNSSWTYPCNTFIGYTTINTYGGTISEIYGGCLGRNMTAMTSSSNTNLCDAYFYGTININIEGGEILTSIYGAGAGGVTGYNANSSDPYKSYGQNIDTTVNIKITGGTIKAYIFGGGYGYTEYLTERTTTADGGTLYGNSNITITGNPVITGNIYGAGRGYALASKPNLAQMKGNSKITISGSPKITGNIYGAGAGVDGYTDMAKMIGNSTIQLSSDFETQMYGGGNIANLNGNTYINIGSGNHLTSTIYGGGNVGEIIGDTYVYVKEGSNNIVYGGANLAQIDGNTNIEITGGNTNTIYGGGNQAGLTGKTNVTITAGQVQKLYGGGKEAQNEMTNVNLIGGKVENCYGGAQAANVTTTNVNAKGTEVTNVFGGSDQTGTVVNSHITTTNGTIQNIYGGNNIGGETTNSNVNLQGGTIQVAYGGNKEGGTTVTSNVEVTAGEIQNVYGGGYKAETNHTNVKVKSKIIQNVYGGGNLAGVTENTNLLLENATIGQNIYGGGNEGTVGKDTYVKITSSKIEGSSYAGGNGVAATVNGNTSINIEGTSQIGNEVAKITPASGCIFGGGNAAPTGTQAINNSIATVNIAGGKIYGNVYGGANTSVVYGATKVNIGQDALKQEPLTTSDILVKGTVFGGGEANAEGSEIYDFSFISVTKQIDININSQNYANLKIEGSIFGSGNASSTSGSSYINFKNYGEKQDPQKNISIQRANVVTIENSAIALSGTTDRTNDYSDVIYTISRIDELKLKNNSTLYLNCGANLLKKVQSLVDVNGVEEKGQVQIQETGIQKNVDNRIYIYQGQNLNIATNQQATSYGDVEGMVFFGLFTNKKNPYGSTGLYEHNYQNGDKITNLGTFSYNSYVKAAHKVDHDTTIDGFYSNYNENGFIKTKYIEVTPADDVYYIWLAGENLNVTTFNISLTASKYTTLGTYELSLTGFGKPNSKMILTGFSSGLEENITLKKKQDIKTVADTEEEADNNYALAMKTGNNGWTTNSNTEFTTISGTSYEGSTKYYKDNSNYTPSLLFYLYHSQNLSKEAELGTVTIRLQVLTPIDDLNDEISYIDVIITMKEALHQGYAYEASITPGEEFSLFTTTPTNITTTSKFSTYYSLYEEAFKTSVYYKDYYNYERVLVSTKNGEKEAFAYPKNTKITMIDLRSNQFYYYVVTEEDERSGKNVYKLADFLSMGSTDKKYNEQEISKTYYDTEKDLIVEEFIFQVDFSQSNMTTNMENNYLLIEMRDKAQETLIGVLGINRDTNTYGLYSNTNSTIQVNAQITNENKTAYLGDIIGLDVATNFEQMIVNSNTVYDTEYFNNKMGIKITIYDENLNQVSGASLLGVKFLLDGMTYYPRIDGTVRINIAERVANVLSKIKIDTTENNLLATGKYTIKIESFGSPDGIYYGTHSSSSTQVEINIINLAYGLDVTIDSNSKIIEGKTGKNQNGGNLLSTLATYSSGLANPNLTILLQRRKYGTVYSQEYETIDLQNYVATTLSKAKQEKEYIAFESPTEKNIFNLPIKPNIPTGTYKLIYRLYDGTTLVGEDFEQFVVR